MTRTLYASLMAGLLASTAHAGDVRIMWYSDGNEGEVLNELLSRFSAENPDIRVTVDNVSFSVVREQLPIQLEAGQGPDIVRTPDWKSQARHWLDLRPLLPDAAYWDENFGAQADWMRPDGSNAITGFMTQLTLRAASPTRRCSIRPGSPSPARTPPGRTGRPRPGRLPRASRCRSRSRSTARGTG